jgi:hypothetical protein
MTSTKIKFLAIGQFPPGNVCAHWTAETRPRIAEVEAEIEKAWTQAASRPGVKLFDGPMCRLESFSAGARLELQISRTSYKIFVGTNIAHPEFAARYGAKILANPIGVSSALETSDGQIMLGRRNASVAYYPLRVHPFAGALEPHDPLDVFAEVRRELKEELDFDDSDIAEIVCLGLVEDYSLRQPELIFRVRSPRTRRQIEATLDAAEHSAAVAIPIDPLALAEAALDPSLTPVATATLLLYGKQLAGPQWFADAGRPVTLDSHE